MSRCQLEHVGKNNNCSHMVAVKVKKFRKIQMATVADNSIVKYKPVKAKAVVSFQK